MHRILLSILFTTSLFAKDIIAVLDLETIGLNSGEATILTQRLTTKLISIGKYEVVERTNMDKILKEQKFQHSGCTDSGCAVEIGQLLNTDYIVIGSVNKFGETWTLDARLIDVALGKGIISAEFSAEGKIDVLLTKGLPSIASQLCGFKDSNIITDQKITSREMEREIKSNDTSVINRNLNSYNIDLKKQKPFLYSAGFISVLSVIIYGFYPSHSDVLTDSNLDDTYGSHIIGWENNFSGYTREELESYVNMHEDDDNASEVLNDWDKITAWNNPAWLIGGGITSLFLVRNWYKKKDKLREKYNISFQPDLQNRNILLRFSYNL